MEAGVVCVCVCVCVLNQCSGTPRRPALGYLCSLTGWGQSHPHETSGELHPCVPQPRLGGPGVVGARIHPKAPGWPCCDPTPELLTSAATCPQPTALRRVVSPQISLPLPAPLPFPPCSSSLHLPPLPSLCLCRSPFPLSQHSGQEGEPSLRRRRTRASRAGALQGHAQA